MRKMLGLLFLVGATACGGLAYASKGVSLENVVHTNWVALPLGGLACLVLGLTLLFGIRRAFGTLLLLAAVTCALFAYANGGPAWGEHFDPRRMVQQGGAWAAAGALLCLILGLPLTLRGARAR
jgi:hypothetical protein